MLLPRSFPVLGMLSLFYFLLLSASLAQPTSQKIAFPKFAATPPGYSRYTASALSGTGINFFFSNLAIPFPFRSVVRAPTGFVYRIPVAAGAYEVKLGVIEFSACSDGARVFRFNVNDKSTAPVDVFNAAGCSEPYIVNVQGVQAPGAEIVIEAIKISGFAPVLANIEVRRTGAANGAPPATPVGSGGELAKIAFQKFGSAPGFDNYVPASLSAGTALDATGNTSVPREFRSHVKKVGGFRYVQSLPTDKYRIVLGFAEIVRFACMDGKRVFKVTVNNKSTQDIDVFAMAGCLKPLEIALTNVKVGRKGKMFIRVMPVSGFAPILSNFRVLSNSAPAPSVAAPASPSPSESGGEMSGGDSPPSGNIKSVVSIDVGGGNDMPDSVVGSSAVYPNVFPIAGTTEDAKFAKHRYSMKFAYELDVKPNIVYSVQLFFAESFLPGCKDDFRKFNVLVYDASSAPDSGKSVKNIDVFKAVGCRTAYSLWITGLRVGASGKLAISFTSVVENAMVSALDVVTTDPNYTPSEPTTPPPIGPSATSSEIDVGGSSDVVVPGTRIIKTAMAVQKSASIPSSALQTGRVGSDFTYFFNLAPGAYDILLGFSENFDPNFCSKAAKRVFNVYVDDMIQLEGFDIFAQAGCRKGLEVRLPALTVDAVNVKPLRLRFSSVVSFAQINYIKITPAVNSCVPASTSGDIASDHAAHAVPGSYPPQLQANAPMSYVDVDGNGLHTVTINGFRSHSHFFDSANDIVGEITDFVWSNVDTGEIVSRESKFSYKFPLGTTRLRLAVTDNSCSRDEAETTVTVSGAIQPGQYCYYYSGLTDVPLAGSAASAQAPQFSAPSSSASLGFPSFGFDAIKFAVRCVFFLETDSDSPASDIAVNTQGTGVAKVYKGEDLILDSTSSQNIVTDLAVGLTGFEVVYLRTNLAKAASLTFLVNGRAPAASKLFYDRSTVVPILTGITPNEGQVAGGARVKVTGYGLFLPLKVKFGNSVINAMGGGSTPQQVFVNTPSVPSAQVVNVVVTSKAGISSNSVTFAYGTTCEPVQFDKRLMKQADGSDVDFLKLPTSAVLGSDGRIYMGTLGGNAQVLGYNHVTLKSTFHCYSKPVRDASFKKGTFPSVRDILGITLDPRDKIIRPYITTSTIYWRQRKNINLSNKKAWQNGAVDRLKPGTDPTDPGVCLVYDKRIVSNLPVSNHDHSVNGLLFTQNGDLLIAVGGNTNMGLPGWKLGNYWESQLSAAILIARLSKPGFNGQIVYSSPDDPRLAKKISGDVDLYATGLRNTFTMAMTSNGFIYASDQGPNCGFGDIASACSEFNETRAQSWDVGAQIDWKGLVSSGWPECPNSLGRPDKILRVKPGKFYGHANLNRGNGECAWIDPYSHKTADGKSPPAKYEEEMTTVQSPITGLEEYRANHFCGKLKGELILSTYKSGKTYRMSVDGDAVLNGPDDVANDGGITFVENAHGDLIFPRLSQKNVFVLKPKVGPQAGLFIAGAVPFRHGRQGGTKIIVGGSGFGTMPKVVIGGKPCAVSLSSDTEITCTVPSHTAGPKSLVVTSGGSTSSLSNAVLYMNV